MASKSITDPLYGYVELTETEAKLVSSRVFQRLHGVRQLGLAHLVFPNAGYSRFAHSIGARHNAARLLAAIERNSGENISPSKKAAYRAAALLHDIGHYPFSHATEHAIKDFYSSSLLQDQGSMFNDGPIETLDHEQVGSAILEYDSEISEIIAGNSDFGKKELLRVFSKEKPDPLYGIISSDLDCDRLDYMARTAHVAGVPYGIVDTDFIIGKATTGEEGELAFQSKSANAIDHFLISRYYDYLQMVFHKTVVALEMSLVHCIFYILQNNEGLLSKNDVERQIAEQNWQFMDDAHMMGLFKDALNNDLDVVTQDHFNAVLHRRPAKLIWKWEELTTKHSPKLGAVRAEATKALSSLATKEGIDKKRLQISDRPMPFVKIGHSEISVSSDTEKARSVRIIDKSGNQCLLVEHNGLLLSHLSDLANLSVGIYYLPPPNESKSVREKLRVRLSNELDPIVEELATPI